MDVKEKFNLWKEKANEDCDLQTELEKMKNSSESIYDAFYKDLEFGTAGFRGIIGAGTNRMNVYTVGKATQGLANYILKNVKNCNCKVAIGYDSRIKSELFAKKTASVLAANQINVYIYPTLSPVPTVSYATRELGCCFGIMITASHNPNKYNGYKVYGPDGCQIISEVANSILNEINDIDIFSDIKSFDFDKGLSDGKIIHIDDEVLTNYINRVKKESVVEDEKINRDVKIIYSPLHGSGLVPVTRILKETGFSNITVVKEQEEPDGNFTTCPYPNPEIKEAMELGIKYAEELDADLLFATDPDCDRVGIAVKNENGNFVLLSGNQTGALLLDFICSMRKKHSKLPADSVCVKTIVTTDLAKPIAESYGVKCIDVLTGFKYIGDQIALLEKDNKTDRYIFGFEESYGYLSGTYVRDKDAVDASLLICEMFAYYKTNGISLIEKLNQLYEKHGLFTNKLKSYEFTGESGFKKMQTIMNYVRTNITEICDEKVTEFLDYQKGINGLPKSNVVKFVLDSGSTISIRPSGTEPKLKVYLSVKGSTEDENEKRCIELFNYFDKVCN